MNIKEMWCHKPQECWSLATLQPQADECFQYLETSAVFWGTWSLLNWKELSMVSIFSIFYSSNQSQVVHQLRRFPLLKTLLPELSALFIRGRMFREHVRSDSLAKIIGQHQAGCKRRRVFNNHHLNHPLKVPFLLPSRRPTVGNWK